MGILSTLKSVLGFGGSSGRPESETTVTVEREVDEDESAEPDATTERAVKEASESRAGSDEREDVQEIKGIGPTYAERLGEAGVETVDDLAGADADDLAEETGISATRIEGWIERARAR